MKNSVKSMITVGALALGSVAVAATPAMASDATAVGSHIVAGGTSAGAVVNGSLTLAFDCTATATAAVVSMSITRCQISTGGPNKTIALPGNTATIAGVATVPLSGYSLCISAVATYLDSSTRSVSTCSALLPLGNGIPQTTIATN